MNSIEMNTRQDQARQLAELYELRADVERQLEITTLSHSDQQLLHQAWDDYTNDIDDLESLMDGVAEGDWMDATVYLESESEPSQVDPMTNSMVDDRAGCEACVGCYYCGDSFGYDCADEV
jgi:hypothetical protein